MLMHICTYCVHMQLVTRTTTFHCNPWESLSRRDPASENIWNSYSVTKLCHMIHKLLRSYVLTDMRETDLIVVTCKSIFPVLLFYMLTFVNALSIVN